MSKSVFMTLPNKMRVTVHADNTSIKVDITHLSSGACQLVIIRLSGTTDYHKFQVAQ